MASRVLISLLFIQVITCSPVLCQSRYYKTETHCHSSNSGDGFIAPADLLQQYKSRFYDIVFLSDHDTLTDVEALNVPGILGINAEELSCGSHFNGFNMKHGVDACGMSNQQKVDSILAQGALVCVNHPVAPRWQITASEILALQGDIKFVEIYNSTDIYEAPDDQSLWDSLLSADRRIWGLASGDVHQFYPLEDLWLGWNMIKLETLNKESVLDAMLRGDFYASTGVDISDYQVNGDTVSVSCSNCVRMIFWGEGHTKLKQVNKPSGTYIRQPGDKYVRVELIFDRFNKAWTQPVFFDNLPTAVQYPANHDPGIRVYPNPASQECQVEFNLIEKQSVRSDLYNLQGQLIRTFLNDVQAAGKHMISLDIRDIPAGSYLLKLSGEQFNYTERVIVF